MIGIIWEQMGFMRWPLAFSAVAILTLTAYSSARVFQPGAWASARTKVFIDAILFWGGFAVITGALGTVIGIIIAAQSIELAGAVETALVWGGIKVALLTSAMGMLILFLSSLVWFGLQLKWRLLQAREADAA